MGNSLTTNKNAFSLQSLHTQNNGDVNRMTLELMATKNQLVKLTGRLEEITRKVNVNYCYTYVLVHVIVILN